MYERDGLRRASNRYFRSLVTTTGKRVTAISDGSLSVLIAHAWPGNVRELKNALEHAVIRAKSPIIQPEDLPPEVLEMAGQAGLLEDFTGDERGRILAALKRTGGNRQEAAEMLGMSRATFYRRLSQLDIDADESVYRRQESPPTSDSGRCPMNCPNKIRFRLNKPLRFRGLAHVPSTQEMHHE